MTRLTLALALALALSPAAQAEDLLEALNLARQSDPVVQVAGSAVRSAEEGVAQARSALLPRIDGTYDFSNSQRNATSLQPPRAGDVNINPQTRSSSDSNSGGLGLDLTQTIYDHANYTRLRAARAQAARVAADYRGAEQALIVRVAQAYFNVLTTEDSLTSSQAEEKAVSRQLDQADQRFEVGLTAITDVHEARARRDGAVAAAILAANAVDDAKAALSELTGKNTETVEPVRDEIPLEPPVPADWQAWVDLALKNSPTLQARKLAEEVAKANIATAKAGHLPSVTSFVSYDDRKTFGDGIFQTLPFDTDDQSDITTVGLRINVPIFAGFATRSRVRQAVADAEISFDQVEQERRAVTRATRNAYRAVIAGVSEVQARKQAQISARSALEATEAGFEVGTRTIVDVLLSQQVLFQAQRDYSQARHNFLLNKLRLKSSAGIVTIADVEEINRLLQ